MFAKKFHSFSIHVSIRIRAVMVLMHGIATRLIAKFSRVIALITGDRKRLKKG